MKKKMIIAGQAVIISAAIMFLVSCPSPDSNDPEKSNDAALSSLALSAGSLSPAFDPETTSYAASVGNATDTITINAAASSAAAKVSANVGVPLALAVGSNTFTLTVTAEDGVTTKDYVIVVSRAAPISSNADLYSLSISAGTLSPAFDPATTDYTAAVDYVVDSIIITGTPSDADAVISGPNGREAMLDVGPNEIQLTVLAKNGITSKVYSVIVSRSNPSHNALLASIAASAGTLVPPFDPQTTDYSVNVGFSVSAITFTTAIADATASNCANSGIPQSLSVGANAFTYSVTAQDGTTKKDYRIAVNRAARKSIAYLSTLSLDKGVLCPAFAPRDVYDYVVGVGGDDDAITISAAAEDPDSTISGNNATHSLVVGGNTVTMTVTAEDGISSRSYTFTVFRNGPTPADYVSPSVGTLKGIPAGVFYLYYPNTKNTVSQFRMGAREITRAQFGSIMGIDPSDTRYSTEQNCPAQNMSWYAMIAFCNKLSLSEGLTPCYSVQGVNFSSLTYSSIPTGDSQAWNEVTCDWDANGYRLPTEAEWTWAAMGAKNLPDKAFAGSNGSNSAGDYAVINFSNGDKAAAVGSKLPNELGIYDMSGNVFERCWDIHDAVPVDPRVDYRGPAYSGYPDRVVKGGGWAFDAYYCTIKYRDHGTACDGSSNYGFRVVRK